MDLKKTQGGYLDVRSLQKQGTPLSEFRLDQTSFRISDGSNGDDGNPPIRRDDAWQDMLRMVLGYVPDGAEHAPPCHCEMFSLLPDYNFAGLAGLPPEVRLMDGFYPVRDQSKRGACFAFALVALCEYMLGKTVELSEQSLFHFTKLVTQGRVQDLNDGVATLRDAVRAVGEYGICPLSEWHYNPESWNYVEDPYNEGQGPALRRKLAMAEQYRFRNLQILPSFGVLEFKQTLSSGRPVSIGISTTGDWHSTDADTTGIIPYPRWLWRIRILQPPRGIVLKCLEDNGLEPIEENVRAAALEGIQETLLYLQKMVFKGALTIHGKQEDDEGVTVVVSVDKDAVVSGGHALCLAGYVDDANYPGGGYFIARNSWFDRNHEVPWASKSPEEPGHALLSYAYVADFCFDGGVTMSDFPRCGPTPASVVSAAPTRDEFSSWLAERAKTISRPVRDEDGVLLRPGSQILVPDLANPAGVLRDTPQNRAKLRSLYEGQLRDASVAAEKERQARERAIADARLIRFETVLRETIDSAFAADEYAVMSLATLKAEMLSRDADLAAVSEIDSRIRASVIALQKGDRRKYWFGRGFGGVEEIRPSGKDSDRISI